MKSRIYKKYKGPEYPTNAHGKIPAFNSIKEEAFFWDTHDMIDYELMDLEDMSPAIRKDYLELRSKNALPW